MLVHCLLQVVQEVVFGHIALFHPLIVFLDVKAAVIANLAHGKADPVSNPGDRISRLNLIQAKGNVGRIPVNQVTELAVQLF